MNTAAPIEVPVLDLAPLQTGEDLSGLAKVVREACLNTGFFYVANHGVDEGLVQEMFAIAPRYFALPLEQRLEAKIDDRFRRGYVPFGISQIPGFAPDLKERFDWGVDLPLTDPDVAAGKPLHGPNKWPDGLDWFRAACERFQKEQTALGRRLLRVIALSLS